MSELAEGYARIGLAIEAVEGAQILPVLEHLATETLPVEAATVDRKLLPVAEDERGPYSPVQWTYVYGPNDVSEALAKATNPPLDVMDKSSGEVVIKPTELTQASVTITMRKTTKTRTPLPGILQMDTVEDHTIVVYDTSVDPPRLHAQYDSIPLEVNYPETAAGGALSPGVMHVDELALARRAFEFPRIQAEQRARLSWLALFEHPSNYS